MPSNPSDSPLLNLPAELRNKIYTSLFEFSAPIQIEYEWNVYDSDTTEMSFTVQANTGLECSLFYTCRMLYEEATSVVYKRNTFYLISCHLHNNAQACAVTGFQEFLNRLGSRSSFLQAVCLDSNGLCDYNCYFCHIHVSPKGFSRRTHPVIEPELLDFTRLLREIWNRGPNIKISFAQLDTDYKNDWRYPARRLAEKCDLPTLTRTFGMIQKGQLNLLRYGKLLARIGVECGGSGGKLMWHPARRGNPVHLTSFTARDASNRLQIVRPKRLAFLDLPLDVQDRVLKFVVCTDQGLSIDLDIDTTLPYENLTITRRIYARLWSTFINCNPVTLQMTTTQLRDDFRSFDKLQRLLRKTFAASFQWDWPSHSVWCMLRPDVGFKITIDFKLVAVTKLEELRISILPLLLETSEALGKHAVELRIWQPGQDGEMRVVDGRIIELQHLRRSAAKALMDVHLFGNGKAAPEIWVNGLGTVVEVHEKVAPSPTELPKQMPDMASTVICNGHQAYRITEMHAKDARARYSSRKSDREWCVFHNCDQFFPFQYSVFETLQYFLDTFGWHGKGQRVYE